MPPRAHRRHRRNHLQHEQQYRQQKQITSQLAELGGTALSQPIFLVTSDQQKVTVSRSRPEVLVGRMDVSSWTCFCDELDEALLTMTRMNKNMKKCCLISLAFFIPLVLICLVAAAILSSHSMEDATSGGGEIMKKLVLPILFLTAFAGSIVWAICMSNYSSKCRRVVNRELEKICYDTSTGYPGVSFKVYIELHYVQVIVSSSSIEIDPADALERADINSKSTYSTNSADSLSTPPTSDETLTPADIVEVKKWRYAIDENTNKIYYFNEETKEVTWENPLEFARTNVKEKIRADGNVHIGGGENKEKVAAEPESNDRD